SQFEMLFRGWEVEADEEINGPSRAPVDGRDEVLQFFAVSACLEERGEILPQRGVVREWELLRRRLEEEVERIEDGQLGNQVDLDTQLARLLGKHHTRQVIAVGILLPVDEMRRRPHAERVAEDRCPGVRRRTQPDNV